jgi:hypothetical protein
MKTFLIRLKNCANLFVPTFEHTRITSREFSTPLEAIAVLAATEISPFYVMDSNYSVSSIPTTPPKDTGIHIWGLASSTSQSIHHSIAMNHAGLWYYSGSAEFIEPQHFHIDKKVSIKCLPIFSVFRLVYDETIRFNYGISEITKKLSGSIWENHKTLAAKSRTQNFFILDADLEITDRSFISTVEKDEDYVNIWYVSNPFNNLVYGHGGPKFFHKRFFENKLPPIADMTLSFPVKIHKTCVGIHKYNWSAFSTWRTALREVFKLALAEDEASRHRHHIWLTHKGDDTLPFYKENTEGAFFGNLLHNKLHVSKINDYPFLEKLYLDSIR